EIDGRLAMPGRPRAFVVGARWLWAGFDDLVRRYDAASLQWMGEAPASGMLAMAPDGLDGVWLVRRNQRSTILQHIDAFGRPARREVTLPGQAERASIAVHPDGGWLVVALRAGGRWRLIVVDLETCRVERNVELPDVGAGDSAATAIDAGGAIHV